MKYLLATFIAASLVFAMPIGQAVAGSGHSHGHSHEKISGEEAVKRASNAISKLSNAKKIDTSWTGIAADEVKKKTFSKGPEWVVIFKNANIKDPSKQTLYLFISLYGDILGANYAGE